MTKYLVKKDLPILTGYSSFALHHVGAKVDTVDIGDKARIRPLIQYGFIEEVKEDSRWRAKDYESYYILSTDKMSPVMCKERGDSRDDRWHKLGNYFKSEETANKVAEALKLFFEHLHTVDEETELYDLVESIETARQEVLADDKRGSDD